MRSVSILSLVTLVLADQPGCTPTSPGCTRYGIDFHVVDANTQVPLSARPGFSEGGTPVIATCDGVASAIPDGGGDYCDWALDALTFVGAHTVTIAASGYVAQTVSFDTGIVGQDTCGPIPAHGVHLIVELQPITH
jgi:hypothetical protein